MRLVDEIARKHHYIGIEGHRTTRPDIAGLAPPAWVYDGPVYAVFVRAFSEAGTLAGVRERIGELKSLGIKTIWLLPIHPIGKLNRKGSYGSPYAIKDHATIDTSLGKPADLRDLISVAHDNGMRIILDFVGNHAARDHIHPALLKKNNMRSHADWTDVADFDFSLPEAHRYLRDALFYWIEYFDIDGYRCDVAGLVPDEFWQEVTGKLLDIRPDIFMLAEWQRPDLHERFFHGSYDWVLYLILKEIRNNQRPPGDIIHWEKEKDAIYPGAALLLRFTENHDLPRTIDVFGRDKFPAFAGLPYCLNGLPLIYAGQEWGIGCLPDLFDRDPVPWRDGDQTVYRFYRRLIALRKEHPALAQGKIENISCDSENVLIFRRYDAQENLIVVANFGERTTVVMPVGYEGVYRDLISDEHIGPDKLPLERFNLYILKQV